MGGMLRTFGAALGQDTPSNGSRAPARTPGPQPGMTYPEQQPDLDLSLQPPSGMGPSGSGDGRTKEGFFASMMAPGGIGPGRAIAGPGYQRTPPPPPQWQYVPGQGPQWAQPVQGRTMSTYNMQANPIGSAADNAYRGNRI